MMKGVRNENEIRKVSFQLVCLSLLVSRVVKDSDTSVTRVRGFEVQSKSRGVTSLQKGNQSGDENKCTSFFPLFQDSPKSCRFHSQSVLLNLQLDSIVQEVDIP